MKNSKGKAILMSGLMAASMMLMPMSAMAADVQTQDAVTIKKTIQSAEGVTVPSTNFKFHVAQTANTDGVTAPASIEAYDVTKTASASFDGLDALLADKLTAAGEYTFTITETAPASDTGFGWTTDPASYTVRAYVANAGNGFTKQYTILKSGETDKQATVDFTNKYTKATSLTVKKEVENPDYVNKNQDYSFTITFMQDKNGYNPTFQIDGKDYTYGQPYTFTLKDGAENVFSNIPAGTTYTLSETGTDKLQNFKGVKYDVTANGAESKDQSAVTDVLAGENTNQVLVKNTYTTITPTGVVTSIAPFIALIAVAAIAIAVYTSLKKRMTR